MVVMGEGGEVVPKRNGGVGGCGGLRHLLDVELWVVDALRLLALKHVAFGAERAGITVELGHLGPEPGLAVGP